MFLTNTKVKLQDNFKMFLSFAFLFSLLRIRRAVLWRSISATLVLSSVWIELFGKTTLGFVHTFHLCLVCHKVRTFWVWGMAASVNFLYSLL